MNVVYHMENTIFNQECPVLSLIGFEIWCYNGDTVLL